MGAQPGQGMSQPGASTPGSYGQSPSMGGTSQGFGGQTQYGQGAPMGGAQAGISSSDMALARQVAQRLQQQLTGIQNIQIMTPGTIYVMAVRGNVMLHGFVTNPNVKQQASQIARAIPGVQRVTDTLRVVGGAGTAPSYGYIPGQSSQMGGAQGTTQQGAAGQGSGAQTQYIGADSSHAMSQSDIALAQQVAQKLQQQTGQRVQIETPGTIFVKVSNGIVTLDGFVSSSNIKQQAEQVAKSISGVRSVKNSLNIGAIGEGQAFGYMPPQGQPGFQQFGNEPYGSQFGGQQPMDQYGQPPYGSQQSGAESSDEGME